MSEVVVKERPILFQGAMVRALLAGTKMQTRRSMRFQPGDETTVHVEHFNQTVIDRHGDEQPGPEVFGAWWDDGESGLRCPYGQPGDRLWVRESMYHHRHAGARGGWLYRADDAQVTVKATDDDAVLAMRVWAHHKEGEHCPSIHMPRWASRIRA